MKTLRSTIPEPFRHGADDASATALVESLRFSIRSKGILRWSIRTPDYELDRFHPRDRQTAHTIPNLFHFREENSTPPVQALLAKVPSCCKQLTHSITPGRQAQVCPGPPGIVETRKFTKRFAHEPYH